MKLCAQFICDYVNGGCDVFTNEITPGGIQRVLELMGGQSAQRWSAIRLVGDNPAVFVQKQASTQVRTGYLESRALFTADEMTFNATSAEMYSGNTRVAVAPVDIPAGQTVYITRQDFLTGD